MGAAWRQLGPGQGSALPVEALHLLACADLAVGSVRVESLPLSPSTPGWAVGFLLFLPSQEETPKGEGTEQEPSAPEADDDGRRHGFLILSREDSTMVRGGGLAVWGRVPPGEECTSPTVAHRSILQTGQEIMELDTSGFATQGPTVFAGNIGDNRYIVQVSPLGIRLLEGGGLGGRAGVRGWYMLITLC